jgi:hypothetical protein
MTATKWFRSEVKGRTENFVDWYLCDTLEQARELVLEDMHRYGIPAERLLSIREATKEESARLQ